MNQKLSEILASGKKYLSEGLVKDIRENWRIIVVAAIVIVVFVSSWGSDRKPAINPSQSDQSSESRQNTQPQDQPENSSNVAQAKEETKTSTGSVIKETAEKSEGVTHLARKAVKEYSQSANETLIPEQKIYAEDYLKRQIGSQPLEIGQTIEFQTDMIKTGIEKAKQLNEKQIENLSKFVPLVKNLN